MKMTVMFLLLLGCSQPAAVPSAETQSTNMATQTTTQSGGTSNTTGPRVVFPDGFVVSVELAADDELRAQGLMFRDQLRPGTGMLFLFNGDEERSFWMKNTKIPLDMIWIGSDRRIVGIMENVPPCVTPVCPGYSPGPVKSRYVLEVAGGVAKQHGLKVGDPLRIDGIENVVVR
jgi:uncharacterized protein